MRNNVGAFPEFREPMKKREWTFSKFVDELKSHMGRKDEYIYYQDALTDAVGTSIKHDFLHFNWKWLNDRRQRYNWGQLTTNLLLISQPGNITPCHYDEQHNYFCQVIQNIVFFKSGPVPSKINYPLNEQQKVAITRNIEKMLNEALQDPAEVLLFLLPVTCGMWYVF
ncbi:Hypoxia-inducible factor 1-alpha inhibitor [Geodia barretti]|uniref:Hypoxia-inducible factor 1-alpha inhibitor n=1 Tax=Geodia barretti TaxID=519541 RepID=A0AA35SBW8_GEOBA|nr:Hypoxia-inducible factor 1-alpha inhibitor [Geodia barretti]